MKYAYKMLSRIYLIHEELQKKKNKTWRFEQTFTP